MGKVIVAMSGGGDSSYAAYLLREQGYEVEGLCLDLFPGSAAPSEAREAGEAIGIRVHVVNKHGLFDREVVDYFCRTYRGGRTPNPCAVCNPAVKFVSLLETAAGLGADMIATGHYARCVYEEGSGGYQLYRGIDLKKDQSYFLYGLGQEVLKRALFPLGGYTKEEVRLLAARAGLPAAAKRDSWDVCFIPDGDYPDFLRRRAAGSTVESGHSITGNDDTGNISRNAESRSGSYTGSDVGGDVDADTESSAGLIPGDFVDREGNVLGQHKGLACYTIGQRKNLGASFGAVMSVLALRPEQNQVVVGPEEALYATEVSTAQNTYISGKAPDGPVSLTVRLRSAAAPTPAMYYPGEDGSGRLVLEKPERAVTPGQSAVYYIGDRVLGGGVIQIGLLTGDDLNIL